MSWQLGIVILVVAGAVLYLGRVAWRSWSGAKSGCGGACKCGNESAQPGTHEGGDTLIPLEQVTMRRR
jgi:hypothetical protein